MRLFRIERILYGRFSDQKKRRRDLPISGQTNLADLYPTVCDGLYHGSGCICPVIDRMDQPQTGDDFRPPWLQQSLADLCLAGLLRQSEHLTFDPYVVYLHPPAV